MINFKEFAENYIHPKPSDHVLKKIEEIDKMREKGYELVMISHRRHGKSVNWKKDLKALKKYSK